MGERLWRRQDDDGAPRSPHPSLRDRPDRRRELALQEPRLTPPPITQGLPERPSAYGPGALGQPLVRASSRGRIARRPRVTFVRRLTRQAVRCSAMSGRSCSSQWGCGVADTTSFRWRHRFLAAVEAGAIKLKGIVEADETYVLTSCKGARRLDPKPRKRGGVAKKRGLSKAQVPILVPLRPMGRPQRDHVHPRHTGHQGRDYQGPPRDLDPAGCAPRHRRRPVLPALRRSPGPHPPAARPKGRRTPPWRTVSEHRQQPPRTAQNLPAKPARRRHQIPRQPSRLVPPRHPAQAADTALGIGLGCRADAGGTTDMHS